MNQFQSTQQNYMIIQNPENEQVYHLKEKQIIDYNQDRFEGERENPKLKILCDCFKQYTDQFMRCLDELITSPQNNIIHYIDFFRDNKTKLLYVIYEYVDKECYLNYQLRNTKFDENQKNQICVDIAQGIYYLHLLSYRHRNINPENICYVNGQYKITHLNYVVHFVTKEKLDIVGDSCYWSQELLLNKDYDHTIDIFAFACVAFEIYTSQKLFSQENDRLRIPQEKVPELQKLPNKIKQFIDQVIVEGKKDLQLFLEGGQTQKLVEKKKQASQIGSQQQFQFRTNQTLQPQINRNPTGFNFQSINSQDQTLNSQDQKRPSTFVPPQFQPGKFPFQQKQSDILVQPITGQQQFSQKQSDILVQPITGQQQFQSKQSDILVQPIPFVSQFQSIQKPQTQIPFMPFQQQTLQDKQTNSKQFPILPDAKSKFPNFNNPNNEMLQMGTPFNNQQSQLNKNSPPLIFDTSQTFHRKNDSQQNTNFQEFNFNQQQDSQDNIFKCQIDTQKEEREKENQKQIKIFNDVQKLVKGDQLEKIITQSFELNKQYPNLSVEEILQKLIEKRVRDILDLTFVQIV